MNGLFFTLLFYFIQNAWKDILSVCYYFGMSGPAFTTHVTEVHLNKFLNKFRAPLGNRAQIERT